MFVARPESLVSFLRESEQHLLRRAQVRQVLAYLRDDSRDRYVREVACLLSDEGIRPQIKELAFALLAEVADPTEEEWAIWERWTAPALKAIEEGAPNPDKLSALARGVARALRPVDCLCPRQHRGPATPTFMPRGG